MTQSINCPSCGETLDVDSEHLDWTVRCPICRHEFIPQPVARPRPTSSRRPRREPESDDDLVNQARRVVSGPASWLRVLGGLGLLAGLAGVVISVSLGVWMAEDPIGAQQAINAPNQEELIINLVMIGIASAMSVVAGAVIMYGAMKMGRLESRGWSMASAVVAIVSLLFCTCCIVVGVPLGIWALMVLNRPDVLQAFEIVARQRETNGF